MSCYSLPSTAPGAVPRPPQVWWGGQNTSTRVGKVFLGDGLRGCCTSAAPPAPRLACLCSCGPRSCDRGGEQLCNSSLGKRNIAPPAPLWRVFGREMGKRAPRLPPCALRAACATFPAPASSPCLCMCTGVPNFSLVFTNKHKALGVIYSPCCLRHLPGEFDPAMFLTYF